MSRFEASCCHDWWLIPMCACCLFSHLFNTFEECSSGRTLTYLEFTDEDCLRHVCIFHRYDSQPSATEPETRRTLSWADWFSSGLLAKQYWWKLVLSRTSCQTVLVKTGSLEDFLPNSTGENWFSWGLRAKQCWWKLVLLRTSCQAVMVKTGSLEDFLPSSTGENTQVICFHLKTQVSASYRRVGTTTALCRHNIAYTVFKPSKLHALAYKRINKKLAYCYEYPKTGIIICMYLSSL